MRHKKACAVFLCFLTFPVISACALLPEEEVFRTTTVVQEYEGEEFKMTTVKRGDIRDYRNIPCEFRKSNIDDVVISPWMEVEKICVNVGDKVKKGDVLVKFVSEENDSDIEDISYQINMKKTLIKQAENMCELEIKRQKKALDDETMIKAIRENYAAQISSYEGELSVLQKQYDEAVAMQEAYQVTATISGTVTYVDNSMMGERRMNRMGPGAMSWDKLDAEIRIVSVSDGSMPYFAAEKDSSEYVGNLSEGDKIKVTSLGDEYDVTVHFPKNDKKYVYFLLDYVPDNIEDGNTANAEYIIEEHNDVLYLPDSAVNKMGDSYIVYYEDENGLKSAKEVTVGLKAENKIEITSGLEFGDAVIVR